MSQGKNFDRGQMNNSPWRHYPPSGYSSTSPQGTLSSGSGGSPNSQCYSRSPDDMNVDSLVRSLLDFDNPDEFAKHYNNHRLSSPSSFINSSYTDSRCRDCMDPLCDTCSKSTITFNDLGHERHIMRPRNTDIPSPPMLQHRCDSNSPITMCSSPFYCELHRESQRFYCQTCSKPFCADCGIHLHVGHVTVNLVDALEGAGLQATQVINEAKLGIAALSEDMESVHHAAETLEQKARDATADVIAFIRRIVLTLEQREKELINRIDKARMTKLAALQTRDDGLRNGVARLTYAVKKLNDAMESSTLTSNPLSLLVAKDNASAEVFNIRQNRQNLPPPEENWISFTGSESNVVHAIANLGSIVVNNPGLIGDRRTVRGRGSERASPQFFPNNSPMQTSGSPGQMLGPIGSKPHGRPVSASSFPVTIRTGRSGLQPGGLTKPIKLIGNDGDARDNLCRPWGVACDKEGHIIVADRSNNRIQIYRQDGSFVRRFGTHGTGPGQFDRPAGVAVDARRRIIVADKDNHRVQVLTMEGIYLLAFGDKGCRNGQFNYPWDVAVNSECQIAVSDTRNHRIQLFSPEGIFLRKFGYETTPNMWKHFDSPRGVAFNPEGNVVVTDFNNHRVVIIDLDFMNAHILGGDTTASGSKQFLRPQGLVIDDEGNIIVADSRNHRIQIFDSTGTLKWKFGSHGKGIDEMDRPSGIALTPDGRIVIVDFGNNRVMLV